MPVAARGGLPHRSLDGMGGCPLPHAEACSVGRRGPAGGDVAVVAAAASFFIFIFFKNIFYRNIFSISQFIILYLYRPVGGPAAARQRGGSDLYVNKNNFYLRGGLWQAPLPAKLQQWAIRCGFRYFGYK